MGYNPVREGRDFANCVAVTISPRRSTTSPSLIPNKDAVTEGKRGQAPFPNLYAAILPSRFRHLNIRKQQISKLRISEMPRNVLLFRRLLPRISIPF
jgi:hypothetical protein